MLFFDSPFPKKKKFSSCLMFRDIGKMLDSQRRGRGGYGGGKPRGRGYEHRGNYNGRTQNYSEMRNRKYEESPVNEELIRVTKEEAEVLLVRFFINNKIRDKVHLLSLNREAFHYHQVKHRRNREEINELELIKFAQNLFEYCPSLRPLVPKLIDIGKQVEEYSLKAPCAGIIVLNRDLTKMLCVSHPYNPQKYSFPKGKIAPGDLPITGAIQQVFEETGCDVAGYTTQKGKFTYTRSMGRSPVTMFFAVGVPEEEYMPYKPGEIFAVDWVNIETGRTNKGLEWFPDPPTERNLPKVKEFIEMYSYN